MRTHYELIQDVQKLEKRVNYIEKYKIGEILTRSDDIKQTVKEKKNIVKEIKQDEEKNLEYILQSISQEIIFLDNWLKRKASKEDNFGLIGNLTVKIYGEVAKDYLAFAIMTIKKIEETQNE